MARKKFQVRGKLGTGTRFSNLKRSLAHRKGVTDASGLAAYIGRKKHGAKKMAKLASKGRKGK